jgi:integrase
MGTVYKRGDSRFWWISFTDATGKRKSISSESDDRETAARLLALAERAEKAKREAGLTEGPLTVERYAEKWLTDRARRGVGSVEEDRARLAHALPRIGRMMLKDVRHRHMRDLVHWLRTDARTKSNFKRPSKDFAPRPLAPRTVRHIYGTLRVMFSDAVVDELITVSPCTLKQRRGELPLNVDRSGWRDTAIFTRAEVEQIISDGRIPEWRRVLWGVIFLAGLRINEFTPRRWRDYDPTSEPLGQLRIHSNYNVKRNTEKPSTKSGWTRNVPVHPTLEKMLREWRLHGWAELMGRHPQPGDLIVPSPYLRRKHKTQIINSHSSLAWFHKDLETIGLRARRQHDARRTFISLGIAGGGRKDILRWISHGPTGEILDVYTTLPWATLCSEILHLKVERPSGQVVPIQGTTQSLR